MPSQSEEDTYNVKKYWSTVLTATDFPSMYVERVKLRIGIPKSRLKPSYHPTKGFGEINCRSRISLKPLTSLPTLLDRSHERATEKPYQIWGYIFVLGREKRARSCGIHEEA